MEFSLDTLRTRIGITDPSDTTRDVELTFTMELVIEILEKYLNRKLLKADDIEVFTHFTGNVISLRRYPLSSITHIDTTNDYHYGKETGLIHFDTHVVAHELEVSYNGGYDVLPNDLVFVALMVFDAVWPSVEGGSVTVAAGSIQSITLQDVGTVRYATGAAAVDSSGSSSLIPATATSILESYRRYLC